VTFRQNDVMHPCLDAELESLETESSNNIELKEFIPLSKIDPVYFESAYYVGAGEGGEKPYRLLADALAKSNRAAIARLVTRGKEQLVLIRPYENGLIAFSGPNRPRFRADSGHSFRCKPATVPEHSGHRFLRVA
jgi:non-homologous end joining protein Ku